MLSLGLETFLIEHINMWFRPTGNRQDARGTARHDCRQSLKKKKDARKHVTPLYTLAYL